MLSDTSWAGVQTFVEDYVGARPGDIAVLPFTREAAEPASWVAFYLEERGIDVRLVPMFALQDDGVAARLQEVMPAPHDISENLLVLVFEQETLSHSGAISQALSRVQKDRCKVFRVMSASEALFAEALHVKPEELSARNTTLLNAMMKARQLRIECPGGTDLTVDLASEKHEWISNRGLWRPGRSIIIPAGEVATYPARVNGRLVADAALNVNTLTDQDVRLEGGPVVVDIVDGQATEFHTPLRDIADLIGQCFAVEHGRRVGELGFGTNTAIRTLTAANSHINERLAGVHLGFGQHNQGEKVDYFCPVHLDLIARGGRVWVDDAAEPIDLLAVPRAQGGHPVVTRDEDAFTPGEHMDGDCCGVTGPCEVA